MEQKKTGETQETTQRIPHQTGGEVELGYGKGTLCFWELYTALTDHLDFPSLYK